MPHHAYWKRHIRLSFVTFPVRLHPAASESEKIHLHKYDKDSGQRIHYQNVNEDGDVVEADYIVKAMNMRRELLYLLKTKKLENCA